MSKRKSHWVIPQDHIDSQEPKLHNGEEFNSAMVGAYYGSSLEYNIVVTPQFTNAQDLMCPMDDQLRKVFKPKRPYGTFGALISDEDQSEYRYEAGRAVIELTSEEEIKKVADSLESGFIIPSILKDSNLVYKDTEGHDVTYYQAMEALRGYREHNKRVQSQIDSLVKERGYSATYRNGKWEHKKYPDDLVNEIADLAKTKKSITGFNLKVQLVGRHTIALEDNYYKSSISTDEIVALAKKCNYKVNKGSTFKTGVIRLGTLIVPIQSLSQLSSVKKVLGKSYDFIYRGWPEQVKKSKINLRREEYESNS